MVSKDYSLEIANAHNITTETVKKLVPNIMNKNNYVFIIETCKNV